MEPSKREKFEALFQEFLPAYAEAPAGQKHREWYARGRKDARTGYDMVLRAAEKGEDVTDLVLRRLLPHGDTTFNRERKAWVSWAPAVTKDIKSWFQNSPGIKTKAADWPTIAAALLAFVRTCNDDPKDLSVACNRIVGVPQMKGFQTGLLSPILNALRPKDFTLINNKSRPAINFFNASNFSPKLDEYPALNETAEALISELSDVLAPPAQALGLSARDAFDMFCHWLVAEKQYPLRKSDYWKIAPGEGAWNWQDCRDEGFIGMGWEELGDLTDCSKEEFEKRCEKVMSEKPDISRADLLQAWKFSRIKEGDYIVANKGGSEVVGVGTVTGDYYFSPNVRHGHRLPVEWIDTRARRISKRGWSKTLIKLDQPTYEEVRSAPLAADLQQALVTGAIMGSLLGPGASQRRLDPLNAEYPLAQFAIDVNKDEKEIAMWVAAVEHKRQIILAGPPGTGKTFCAEHLARHLLSGGSGISELVQFHPAYGYEDFMQGIRPEPGDDGVLKYPMVPGRFVDFCRRAEGRGESVLIIDEINRANLSRVFGELLYLLENRVKSIPLAGGNAFKIPENVVIIGTMNTADRSIALMDHALRRRFAYLTLGPDLRSIVRFHEQHTTGFDPNGLVSVLERLNKTIEDPHYSVGVSYFMNEDLALEGVLERVWKLEIDPYLDELFFDQLGKVASFRWEAVKGELTG